MAALKDIRIVDITRAMAGPYCTMMLGDFGADIIRDLKIYLRFGIIANMLTSFFVGLVHLLLLENYKYFLEDCGVVPSNKIKAHQQ